MHMKTAGVVVLASSVSAWGSLGHITTAFLAGHLVKPQTETFFQGLLGNSTSDYLANIATWADGFRYSHDGQFTKTFHFIDAKDNPPYDCNVDFERDCKSTGCVVSSIANYTTRVLDSSLDEYQRNQAAKFVVHFVGDLHQPLHNENVQRGGNGIRVKWNGIKLNLHHVWDSTIAEQWVGGNARRHPYPSAEKWAQQLLDEVLHGKYAEDREKWLGTPDYTDMVNVAMGWSREANQLVCTHVLPEGAVKIRYQELMPDYFKKAGPAIELQVARGGVRLAGLLDYIAETYKPARIINIDEDEAEVAGDL